MEILIRTKQSNNPQFSFLSIDGELHPYYKLLLEAIKTGKINPDQQPEKEEPGRHIPFSFLIILFSSLFCSIKTRNRNKLEIFFYDVVFIESIKLND